MSEQTVIPRIFGCAFCGTIWYCNRAEPGCVSGHPGRWHVQDIDFSEDPCASCQSWIAPFAEQEAIFALSEENVGEEPELILMFPPDPITERENSAEWDYLTIVAYAIRGFDPTEVLAQLLLNNEMEN